MPYEETHGLFHGYTGHQVDPALRDHWRDFYVSFTGPEFGLRKEPKVKATMGPDLFMYQQHFLWARDTSRFHTLVLTDSMTLQSV
jgi:hypothetical protein